MFPEDCYPYEAAGPHAYFYLETPKRGGHLGYWWPGMEQSWAELRAYQFVREVFALN